MSECGESEGEYPPQDKKRPLEFVESRMTLPSEEPPEQDEDGMLAYSFVASESKGRKGQ